MEVDSIRPEKHQLVDLQGSDAPRVFNLLELVYDKPEHPLGGGWTLRLLEIELDRGFGLGLELKGVLEAMVLYRRIPEALEISVLATSPKVRRQGLMQRLLMEVLGRRRSKEELWLEVHEKNKAARKLYEKLGFIRVGDRPKYYRDGAKAVLYSWRG